MPKKTSDKKTEAIIELLRQGLSYRQIAKKLKLHPVTVGKIARKLQSRDIAEPVVHDVLPCHPLPPEAAVGSPPPATIVEQLHKLPPPITHGGFNDWLLNGLRHGWVKLAADLLARNTGPSGG